MDHIERILCVCNTIYQMVENTKANKERCQRVAQRVKALEELVLTIKQRGPGQISATVDKALKELCLTLVSAREVMRKYSQTKSVKSFLRSSRHEEQFSKVNERLTDNFQVLSGALQIEQGNILYKVAESVLVKRQEQPLTSPIAPVPPPTPVSGPTAPMPPPTPVSGPTAPMPPPMPIAPLPVRIPMCNPTTPISVNCMLPPSPVFVPAASMPVRCIMSPMQVSNPMNPMPLTRVAAFSNPLSTTIISQHVPVTMSSIVISPTTAPMAPMPLTRPVAPMTILPQNTSVVTSYVKSFLR